MSKVVAVPKSIIIKFFLFLQIPIALAILSDPTCFLFTFIFYKLLRLICFSSLGIILKFFFIKNFIILYLFGTTLLNIILSIAD